jgi:hypothetical protein
MIGVSSTRQATQPKHSQLKIATPRQSRLKRIRGGVEEVYKSCVHAYHHALLGLMDAFVAVQQKRQGRRRDMVLHCPADDGVVVRRVAPIPGDFSDNSCMADGFENMRKPRMRPQLKTYRQRPHASPSHMTPSCSRTSKTWNVLSKAKP